MHIFFSSTSQYHCDLTWMVSDFFILIGMLDWFQKTKGVLKFPPSRRSGPGDKLVISDDDLFILNTALQLNGVVISRDHYRKEKAAYPKYRDLIAYRLLQVKGLSSIIPGTLSSTLMIIVLSYSLECYFSTFGMGVHFLFIYVMTRRCLNLGGQVVMWNAQSATLVDIRV